VVRTASYTVRKRQPKSSQEWNEIPVEFRIVTRRGIECAMVITGAVRLRLRGMRAARTELLLPGLLGALCLFALVWLMSAALLWLGAMSLGWYDLFQENGLKDAASGLVATFAAGLAVRFIILRPTIRQESARIPYKTVL